LLSASKLKKKTVELKSPDILSEVICANVSNLNEPLHKIHATAGGLFKRIMNHRASVRAVVGSMLPTDADAKPEVVTHVSPRQLDASRSPLNSKTFGNSSDLRLRLGPRRDAALPSTTASNQGTTATCEPPLPALVQDLTESVVSIDAKPEINSAVEPLANLLQICSANRPLNSIAPKTSRDGSDLRLRLGPQPGTRQQSTGVLSRSMNVRLGPRLDTRTAGGQQGDILAATSVMQRLGSAHVVRSKGLLELTSTADGKNQKGLLYKAVMAVSSKGVKRKMSND
jgi:hypothetical protein